METNKELMRAEFEAWADGKCTSLIQGKFGTGYVYTDTAMAWEAWQAALSQRSDAATSAAAGEQCPICESKTVMAMHTCRDCGTEYATPADVAANAAQPTPAQGDAVPVALSDEDIVSVLHGCGIDTHPSKYGFTELQVSATSIPSIREVVRRCNELLATRQSSADAGDAALELAVSAIYFDDGSKYEGALWNIVRALSPSILELLHADPRAAFYAVKSAIAAQNGKGEKE